MKVFVKPDLEKNKAAIKPGNFIVTHGHDFFDRLIQLFTLSHWNHAAVITSASGNLIEQVTSGIRERAINEYKPEDLHIIDLNLSSEDRRQVVAYARFLLQKHTTYGFLTIVSIAFKIITRSRLIIKLDGTLICSEFVANALAEGGIIWDKDTSLITPADLYKTFVKKM